MAEQRASYVIIGSGIAGITACEVLRAENAAAAITVVSDDPFPVYYRPALKDYLGGRVREDQLWARPTSFYQKHQVRFLANRMVCLQPDQHQVILQTGEQLPYDRLLLATGASARRLRCPGSALEDVFTLRTVADYQRLLLHLKTARRVVVSGSGALALETVETLRHRGYQVVHLLRHPLLWSEVLDQTASDLILQQEQRDGVEVRIGEEIAELSGKGGHVTSVVTTSGARFSCDSVIIAIGIEPVIDFIKAVGIACGRGVQVDEATMRTSVSDVYAAGDLLETSIPGNQPRLLGQWYPAIQQGRAAAYSMLGLLDTSHPFRFGTFYNATSMYGLDLAVAGLNRFPPNEAGYEELVADPQPRTFQKVILKDGVPVGMLTLGNRKCALALKRAMDHQVNLREVAARLFDDDFRLSSWLDQQQIPPPILGVSREGAAAFRQVAYSGLVARPSISEPPPVAQAWLIHIPTIVLSEEPSEASWSAGRSSDILPDQQGIAGIGQQGATTTQTGLRLSQTAITSIGRQAGASLRLSDQRVSRRHAEISYLNGQYLLRDLGSSNSTWVNEERLAPGSVHILHTRDRLRFGGESWLFEIRPEGPAPDAEPLERRKTSLFDAASLLSAASGSAPLPSSQPALATQRSQPESESVGVASANRMADLPAAPALVVAHHQQQTTYHIHPGKPLRIGRTAENDVVLADVTVSRAHAEVVIGSDGCYIRDLGSSNGILVNQTRIDHPYRLSPGDHLLIGTFQLTFVDERSAPGLADERNLTLPLPRAERVSEPGTITG